MLDRKVRACISAYHDSVRHDLLKDRKAPYPQCAQIRVERLSLDHWNQVPLQSLEVNWTTGLIDPSPLVVVDMLIEGPCDTRRCCD